MLLYGTYELLIDDKNRLLIPADIRKGINPEIDGSGLFVVTGVNEKLWLYPNKYYESIASQSKPEMAPDSDKLAFDHLNYALTDYVEWDKQGRVLLPDKMIRKSRLSREVMAIGSRDHVEVWNRADWAAHVEELERRRAEIGVRAKQLGSAAIQRA